jgi:hypothetical protein
VAWFERVAWLRGTERACCASPLHPPVIVVVVGAVVGVVVVGTAVIVVVLVVDYSASFSSEATVRRQHQWI